MPLTYLTVGNKYRVAPYSTVYPTTASIGTVSGTSVQITGITGPPNFTYSIVRNGTTIATGQTGSTYTDSTVAGLTTYTYQIIPTNQYTTGFLKTIGTAATPNAWNILTSFSFTKTAGSGTLSWTSMGDYANLICCSITGQYVYAWIGASTYPFYSSNYGATFAQSTCSSTVSSWWGQMGCSSSGQYVWLVSNGGIFYSNNYGVSYTSITSTVNNAVDVAVSADGTKVMIGGNGGSSSQSIAYSTNGTATTPTFTTSASVPWGSGNTYMFAYSLNLEYIYTTISNNSTTTALWYTTNQGTSWTSLATPWNGAGTLGLACDQTGKYVGNIPVNGSILYYSTNYGASWTTVNLPQSGFFGLQIKSSETKVNILASGNNATCGLYWGVSSDGINFTFGTFSNSAVTGGYRLCALSNNNLASYVMGGTSTTGIVYGSLATIPTPDLVWFKFDSTTYTGVQTLVNAGTAGTVSANFWSANGTITNTTQGGSTCAYITNTFTGSTGKWTVTTSSITLPTNTAGNGWTVSYWMYIPTTGSGGGLTASNGAECMLASFTSNLNTATQGWISSYYSGNYFNGSGNNPSNLVYWYLGNAYNVAASWATSPTGSWHHIAFVITSTGSTNGTYALYHNGSTESSGTTTAYPASGTSVNFAINANSANIYYRDVRVYGTPLSPAQINYMYNST